MKVLGIVAEYNPFHLGHQYQIQEARRLYQPDLVIAIMSSHLTQRGEVACFDKWFRSMCAIKNGIDLVIELPSILAMQSADYFAYSSLKILNQMHITDLVFGVESNNQEKFMKIAQILKSNHSLYNELVHQSMKQGMRYAESCNEALKSLLNEEIRTPNDLLGFSYVKEILSNNYPINYHTIKRTNNYHDLHLSTISSASAIRKAMKQNLNISNQLPNYPYIPDTFYDNESLFPFLQYQLLVNNHLDQIHLIDEGIENKMKKEIMHFSSMHDYTKSLVSRRYTYSRIMRSNMHILIQTPKLNIKTLPITQIRPLAMNNNGRQYLKSMDSSIPITTKILDKENIIYQKELLIAKLLDDELYENEIKSIPYIE